MKKILLISSLLLQTYFILAQQKLPVTVNDIFQKGVFRASYFGGLRWLSNGEFYTSMQAIDNGTLILKHKNPSGKVVDTVLNTTKLGSDSISEIEEYGWNSQENALLLEINSERIFRRSSKSKYCIYNLKNKSFVFLAEGKKCSYATFSPDGNKVAYVRDNNLFVTDIASMKETAITSTGKLNHIIHGSTDWVYEEEFEFAQAFFWSPNSRKIAFYTFDESAVKEYNMQTWGKLYPEDYKFKYPKAGEANSVVTISVYDVATQQTNEVDLGKNKDFYIPRILWTQNPRILALKRLNRLQNEFEIIFVNVEEFNVQVVYAEQSDTYVEINNDWYFTDEDNKSYIMTSEKDGFRHLYRYSMLGGFINQITTGAWDVSKLVGVDEVNKKIYYTSSEVSPLESHLYEIGFDGKNKKQLTSVHGSHDIEMSPDFKFYLDYYSDINTPPAVNLVKVANNTVLKSMEDNAALKARLQKYDIAPAKFFQFTTTENVSLNAWMIKPSNFDSTKKYPVLMYVYGGPGVQTVVDEWTGGRYMWHQALANLGYIVVSVDNRGTGSRGVAFKKCTYAKLGELETKDQIEAAAFLGSLPYVDSSRIGIWGWSYGGYMSSLCVLYGNELFKMAIAVAPVTSWRFYDNIYTERYLKTPQSNPEGYDKYSPITLADRLKGSYLIVHGTSDDNVHYQNAIAMQDALIKANKQFTSFTYPNKAHGISGGNTTLHLFNMLTDFVKSKL